MTIATSEYQFKFEVVDPATGDVLISDYCTMTRIDEFGGCEIVDIHVASALRALRKIAHEKEAHA